MFPSYRNTANQLAGFYMMGMLIKGLRKIQEEIIIFVDKH